MPKTKQTETGLEPKQKQVQIIRKEMSSHVPVEVQQTSIHRLGSVYVNGSPHRIDQKELERMLIPLASEITSNSPDYRKEVLDFWRTLTVKVPSEGTVLNVSVDEEGFPEDAKDYLTYLWASTHPHVASTRDEMMKYGKKKFYIHDPERETTNENDKVKAKAAAYKEFVKVLDDPKAIDRVLRVIGNTNPSKMTKEQKENSLHKALDLDPVKFKQVATDTNLEIKDFLSQLIESEVLRKAGNTYFYMDDVVGEDMEEAVGYIKNPKNSKIVNDLKAKLEDRKQVQPA